MLRSGIGIDGVTVEAAEPDLQQSWLPGPDKGTAAFAAAERAGQGDGEKGAPFQTGGHFGWHLYPEHSGLRMANLAVGTAGNTVTIVHLDTGYDPAHRALPIGLDRQRQKNFVENTNDASDATPTDGLLRNRGHGTGTIGILAGGDANGLTSGLPIPAEFGPIGGAPMAQVVPVRIANSVVEFWTSTVAQGINYARAIGADVLSMSMGGLPSDAWADAVNLAYEAGVVLVCAAGNSFGGLPTSLIVYPARFDRVIAACGIMAGGAPYYGLSGGVMEGCAGPIGKMATAMAASTPNIPWLRLGDPEVVDMDGAGTSAATPQVAAAAALWLAKNGARFPARDWQRVEAVRAALFQTGRLPTGAEPKPNRFFGQGALDALGAVRFVPDAATLQKTNPDSASFGFLHLLSRALGLDVPNEPQMAMYRLEMTQLALTSKAARAAVPEPDGTVPLAAQHRFIEVIMDEGKASIALREHLDRMPRRGAGGDHPPTSVNGGGPAPPDPEAARATGSPAANRKVVIPRPNRRRLRIFATDPGDSRRLATSFINTATIEVPWEEIEPGPVGEYLEVVDVDPGSNAAYPPVDLEDRYLLAQDGIAPSEGNPQFHQQMVYAVAMRTIRNFETALGRKALWSERRMPPDAQGNFVSPPNGGYVRRLRIYPHALRQENAYYSPQRKALLFGYFNAQGGPSRGRQVVFTCLSHDIIAHETTHALLDGLHRRFQEPTNPDVLAFHEAFADIVAIFQHFTFPELLRYELARLRGDLSQASIMSDLARQFGRSLHNSRALRQAIKPGSKTEADDEEAGLPLLDYRDEAAPHERGAVLVAAMFEAFVAIYTRRTQDLVRMAGVGLGAAATGAIHPDLVNRLASEAVDTAQRVLTTAIRALDYMPPIDPTFGDYLRAIVTADADMEPDHGMGYRVAFAEAFARRSIYPDDVPSVSPDGLLWQTSRGPIQDPQLKLNEFLQDELKLAAYTQSDRRVAFDVARANAVKLHAWMERHLSVEMARSIGLDLQPDTNGIVQHFEVHSVRPAMRTTMDGEQRADIVATVTQKRWLPVDPSRPVSADNRFVFRGGCTLLLDRRYGTPPIRYAICRPVWDEQRADLVRRHLFGTGPYRAESRYGVDAPSYAEPFAGLHATLAQAG